MKATPQIGSIALCVAVCAAAACSSARDDGPAAPSTSADGGSSDATGAEAGDGDAGPPPPMAVEPGEADSVGAATSRIFDERAYDQPAATMTGAERTAWITGQATFQLEWTDRPSADRGGLGPTFNAISCEACHTKNGRGAPPLDSGDSLVTTLLRLGRPGPSGPLGPEGDPTYGDQLQHLSIAGVPSEGIVRVTYETIEGTYGDGTPFTLLRPRPEVEAKLGALPADTALSLRLAQHTLGMGFLEAIADSDLVVREDAEDKDGNGISGRANRVHDARTGDSRLGRFGWKASQPTVEQQSAAAFSGDLGITSALFPNANCPTPQASCAAVPPSGEPELADSRLAAVTTFMRGTSVPGRRDAGGVDVLRGKAVFHAMGCASCHVPSWTTSAVSGAAFLGNVRVWPYTDLLLHDMGEGLADNRSDFTATGTEWRTPPLWGIGLLPVVSKHDRLLHDGRARGFAEAILWHGGEAKPASERFRLANAEERRVLLAFLADL